MIYLYFLKKLKKKMRLRKAIRIIKKYFNGQYPANVQLDIENLKKNKEETINTATIVKENWK